MNTKAILEALKPYLRPFVRWVRSQPRNRRLAIYAVGILFALIMAIVTLVFSGDSFTLWGYSFTVPARAAVVAWLIPFIAPALALLHVPPSDQ